ncbi:MAG: glycosyltransferase family 9 protein [Victivallales bacterium]|nr:glycosyltransferase family 9 protein [Victivallales bacterium]
MGYGDYLMLTALADNARRNNRKISFYYLTSRKSRVRKKNYSKIEVLENNPDVAEILIESRISFLLRRIIRFFRGEKDYLYFPLRRFTQAYMIPGAGGQFHFKLKNTDKHAVEAFCQMAKIKACSLIPKVFLTDAEQDKVDAILKENGIGHGSYVIIETGTLLKASSKEWKAEYWRRLVGMIRERYPELRIIQISPGQEHFAEVADISGETSFRESLHFVRHAAAVIATEGALMHSAAVYGTPCIVLIPRSISLNLSAYTGQVRIFYDGELDCAECGCLANCPRNNFCMNEISPERVFGEFVKLMDKGES